MSIELKEYNPCTVKLFNDETPYGNISYEQLLDVRCQVAEKRLNGFYFETTNGNTYKICNDGTLNKELEDDDNELFDVRFNLVKRLLRVQKKIGIN